MAAPFYIPTSNVCGSANTLLSVFVIIAILVCKCYLLLVLTWNSLMNDDIEHLFKMCLLALWKSSLENVHSDPLPILNWVICVFTTELFFIYSRSQPFIRYMIYRYFLPFCGLSFFTFLMLSFKLQKLLTLIKSNISVLFGCLCFKCHI